MAGRPKAENPRSRLIGVRITAAEGEVLDALAALEKSTASEIARRSLQLTLLAAIRDEHVKEMVELQRRHAGRATADVVPLTSRPIGEAR